MKLSPGLFVASAALLMTANADAAEPPQAPQAQVTPADTELDQILSRDISELTVTSAAKREQKLTDVPAAVYVLTQEDLRRSGATTIPDALRMVPGLEVAQTSSNAWAVTARGFNASLSGKLLVMIDGRSIYTPVHDGVYWADQGTLMEDIDHIEVIRGPGASLWGANAVDGIINIITKNAADTQGNYASAGIGTDMNNFIEGRHGGQTEDGAFYRVYGQYSHFGPTESTNGNYNNDSWYRFRSGFRMDNQPSQQDSYTVQGDVYGGQQNVTETLPTPTSSDTISSDDKSYGGNILARWNHQVSTDSTTSLQAYIDHYSLLQDQIADQHISTADIQFQNNIKLNERNNFIWGVGGRLYDEDILGTFGVQLNDPHADHYILNTFVQDEYALVRDKVFLTLGSKFEYNDFTGFVAEPSARVAWHLTSNQMVWAAVSRAVQTPSSIEQDVSLAGGTIPGTPPVEVRFVGNPDEKNEDLTAYEIGHRIQPTRTLSFDTSLFYNEFTDLLAVGAPGALVPGSNGTFVEPFQINNLGSGHVYGGEEAINWNVTSNWRLAGGYTYLIMELNEPPSDTLSVRAADALAPTNQFSIRSFWNVTDRLQWDNMLYYVSAIQSPVNAYFRYDTRIGWQVQPGMEASLIGSNLLDNTHPEFPTVPQTEEPRSMLARITLKF